MKMTQKISALLLTSTLVACGGGGGGGGGSDPVTANQGANGVGGSDAAGSGQSTPIPSDGNSSGSTGGVTGSTALDCNAAWAAYVKANPSGLNYAYKSVNETFDASGKVTSTVTITVDNRIIRSDDTKVVTSSKTSFSNFPATQKQDEVSKADFLANCGKVSGIEVGDVGDLEGADAKVLEQSAQSLKVAAGTFSTNYTKVLVTQKGTEGETTLASWLLADGSNILVKSDVWTNTVVDGKAFKNHNVTELTKLVRP